MQRLETHPRPEERASYREETVRNLVPLAQGDPFFAPLFAAWQRRTATTIGTPPAELP